MRANTPVSSAPEDAAHAVHAEHVQRVVHAEQALQAGHAPQAQQASQQADHDGAHRADEAGCRGDRHQAGHGARGTAQHRRLALADPLAEGPRQHGSGGSQQRVDEGQGGAAVGFQARAGVEAEPAEPQQRGADHGEGQAVRTDRLAAEADALAVA